MQRDPRQDGQDQQSPFQELRKQMNLLLALTQIISAPLEPWLRQLGTFGERYFGFHLAAGLAVLLVGPVLFFPTTDPRPALAFLIATLFVMAIHRLEAWKRRRKGFVCHSRYSGTPWLPGEEVKAKTVWQPFLAVLSGAAMCLFSPPLGAWMVTAGVCLALSHGFQQEADKARIRAMRDAQIEAEYYTARYREEARREE
jgi:hypothetical protein